MSESIIVSAACAVPPSQVSCVSAMPIDSSFAITDRGCIHVCLCDIEAADRLNQYTWAECSKHNWAIKLASMNGLSVMVHAINKDGDIVPLKT